MSEDRDRLGAGREFGVSVVIPTFNRARVLPRALDSALTQGWDELEIVVVDDGSTDETGAVLATYKRNYADRVTVIRQANSGSPGIARNVGIRAARHPYIALLDSDDAWRAGKLRKQMARFASEPGVEFCFTAFTSLGRASRGDMVLSDWDEAADQALHRLLIGCCVWTSTVVATRRLLLDLGLFDPSLHIVDDYDMWVRVAAAGYRMAYVAEPLIEYADAGSGISADSAAVESGLLRVLERHVARPDLPPAIAARRGWYLAHRHLNNACDQLATGASDAAARSLMRAFRARPSSARPGWLKLLATACVGMVRRRSN